MVFDKGDIVTCIEDPDDDYVYTTPGVDCYVIESDEFTTFLFVCETSRYEEEDWDKATIYSEGVWEVATHNFELVKKHFINPFSKIKSLLR